MDVTGLQIGFDTFIALVVSLLGAAGVWYTLKGKVAIQQLILTNLENDLSELKSDKKESKERLHKRIDELQEKVDANREKNEQSIAQLRDDMAKMKIEIIEAIHEIKRK
jgi:uncharacterized protein YlxW (UPF0749 family)